MSGEWTSSRTSSPKPAPAKKVNFRRTFSLRKRSGLVGSRRVHRPRLAYHRGRGVKLNAWDLHEDTDSVDLFVSLFNSTEPCQKVSRSEASDTLARCRRFLEKAMEGLWKELRSPLRPLLRPNVARPVREAEAGQGLPSDERGSRPRAVSGRQGKFSRSVPLRLRPRQAVPVPRERGDPGTNRNRSRRSRRRALLRQTPSRKPGSTTRPWESSRGRSWQQFTRGGGSASWNATSARICRLAEQSTRRYSTPFRTTGMFLAYNNGISTVAESVETESLGGSVIRDPAPKTHRVVMELRPPLLSTTHRRTGERTLSKVFVQFKLTVLKDPCPGG